MCQSGYARRRYDNEQPFIRAMTRCNGSSGLGKGVAAARLGTPREQCREPESTQHWPRDGLDAQQVWSPPASRGAITQVDGGAVTQSRIPPVAYTENAL